MVALAHDAMRAAADIGVTTEDLDLVTTAMAEGHGLNPAAYSPA